MLHKTMQMEAFSKAYVRAIASVAGYDLTTPEIDDDSIDLMIVDNSGRRARLELQLKATGQAVLKGDHVAYPLPIKNYDDLRAETITPRILIVVLIPDSAEEWILQTERELIMRRCAYWQTLAGMAESSNSEAVTVHLPRARLFSVEQLRAMMERIDKGESV